MTMQPAACSTAARVTLHMIPYQPCPSDQEIFISLSYLLSADLDADINKILVSGGESSHARHSLGRMAAGPRLAAGGGAKAGLGAGG